MKKVSLLLLMSFLCSSLFAQQGSFSLLHTQTARTYDAGRLVLKSNMNFYTKLSNLLDESNPSFQDYQANNYWLVNSGLAITYGISDNFDLTLSPGIYQDTHTSNEFNLPDDITLGLKVGSFDFANRHMYGGFLAQMRFPVGEDHNYPFTTYASGALEYGLMGALSYYIDPYLPDRSFNIHLNVQFWNHNEAKEVLFRELVATKNSTALRYAIGLVYPTQLFDFQLEFFGNSYLEQPDEFVFSREDWMYVTPSIRYKAMDWLSFDFGIDVSLSSTDETSVGVTSYNEVDLPNYAEWKVHLGLNLTILPLGAGSTSAATVERQQFNQRVEFFQEILEERERSQNIQEELDKLQQERAEAEKELEELKQILEEEGED